MLLDAKIEKDNKFRLKLRRTSAVKSGRLSTLIRLVVECKPTGHSISSQKWKVEDTSLLKMRTLWSKRGTVANTSFSIGIQSSRQSTQWQTKVWCSTLHKKERTEISLHSNRTADGTNNSEWKVTESRTSEESLWQLKEVLIRMDKMLLSGRNQMVWVQNGTLSMLTKIMDRMDWFQTNHSDSSHWWSLAEFLPRLVTTLSSEPRTTRKLRSSFWIQRATPFNHTRTEKSLSTLPTGATIDMLRSTRHRVSGTRSSTLREITSSMRED